MRTAMQRKFKQPTLNDDFKLYYFPAPFAMSEMRTDDDLVTFLHVFAADNSAYVLVCENQEQYTDGDATASGNAEGRT